MIYTKPKEWQIRGATFLYKKIWGILGFKTGKGKSLTLLACIHNYTYNKPTYSILFGPKNAIEKVWPKQIQVHSNMKYITLVDALENYALHRSWDFLNDYDIVLVKYSEVLKYINYIGEIVVGRITAYDEIHELKNPNAKLTRALTLATHKRVKAKWGLTATSLTNSIMDLWGVVNFLDPTFFGSEKMFKSKYCELKDQVVGSRYVGSGKKRRRILKKVKVIDGYKNLNALRAQVEKFMIIVENDDLNVNYHKIYYEMNDFEDKTYLTAAEGILELKKFKEFAQRIPDLQRVADGSRDEEMLGKKDYRSSKYNAYLAKINQIVAHGESVLVFAENIETQDMLKNLFKQDLPNVPLYEMTSKKVQDPKKFPCVTVCSSGASASLNLAFSNHVMFYSVPFSVETFIQMVGRITRMDSEFKDDLNVYLPDTNANVDLYKTKYLLANAELINTVIGRDVNLPTKELGEVRRSMLKELRKELLWRTRQVKKKL